MRILPNVTEDQVFLLPRGWAVQKETGSAAIFISDLGSLFDLSLS